MQFIGVDLGSTNIKAACFNEQFEMLESVSVPVVYERSGKIVEFPASGYVDDLIGILKQLVESDKVKKEEICQIAFTGQAESLVILDKDGKPLKNAISWMDERSVDECERLDKIFDLKLCESVTGQQAVLPTWPATKIDWIRTNEPEIFEKAATYMLLKDFVVYSLTGARQADQSIATFSFYFNIYEKHYWKEMLDEIQVKEEQLPTLVEPCSVAGGLLPAVAEKIGLSAEVKVNHGTLDHFAGMVGTGNVDIGGVSLSTGTVMALTTMAKTPITDRNCGVAMHYGFKPDTWCMLPVAESGGVSLEWFRKSCMPDVDYGKLNAVLAERQHPGQVIFLPYIVGTNAPDFDSRAAGTFYGLRAEHDAYDMAAAVMEGVAFLLRRNCDHMNEKGAAIDHIIATGGGAKSDIWCQMQADITGYKVVRPSQLEAACLGAAMIAAVSAGAYESYEAAAEVAVKVDKEFIPHKSEAYERNYKRFMALYEAILKVAEI